MNTQVNRGAYKHRRRMVVWHTRNFLERTKDTPSEARHLALHLFRMHLATGEIGELSGGSWAFPWEKGGTSGAWTRFAFGGLLVMERDRMGIWACFV